MGGRPLCAMNIVCFPSQTLALEVLREILAGGLAKLREAEVALVGGHSVEDPELKYGLSVSGLVHPRRILANRGIRPGDRLILTKPLGTGIISTAAKAELAGREALEASAESMRALNRRAAQEMSGFAVHACTDVTGFGLAGHACEMIEGEAVGLLLDAAALPLLPEALAYAEMGLLPAGLHRNREYRAGMVEVDGSVAEALQDVLFDPQTSGGLLIAVAGDDAERLRRRLVEKGVAGAALIGEATADHPGRLRVR